MTKVLCASVILLLLAILALPVVSMSEDERSANGSFQVSMENGQSRDINFSVRLTSDGSTSGEITFRDRPVISTLKSKSPDPKSQSHINGEDAAVPFYAKAECDCLMIKGIEAVIGGTITEASVENYVGRRVLLVVQDGDSLKPPLRDKLTFGFYKITPKNWIATDAERPDDGPAPTWVATDAERPDDAGTLSQKSEQITCESFPISAHSFIGSKQGRGTIEVRR